MSVIGQPLSRVDGVQKITGTATYSGDMNLKNQAHAVLVLSSVPKGRIVSFDDSAISRLPGILHVMTCFNAPRLPHNGRAGVNPPAGRVLSLLQEREIHYNREPIAVVAAETLAQASAAAALLEVRYQTSPAVLDFAAGEANAHSPGKVNGENADSTRGVMAGVRASAQVSATYETPLEHHNPLEPHATLAHWDGDQVTLYDSTQFITGAQTTLAKVLGLPKDHVRFVCPFVGGGFGCKGSMWSHVALAALMSRHLHRPVKLVLERPQMFGPVGGRPRTLQRLKVAAEPDGRLIGIQHDVLSHTSVMEDFTEPAALQTRIMYSSPNVSTSHRLVALNVGTPTFQRAPGHATGTFALESSLDELAYILNMDPIELRLRNEPDIDPEKKLPWSARSLRACYAEGAAAFGWSRRTAAPKSMQQGDIAVGLGMAAATYPANRQAAQARARMQADGLVVVQSGTQELGTGTYTVMSQVAADALDYPVERIKFELGDSALPQAPVSGGSQSVASVAPAVQAAALALRGKLIDLAIADPASSVHGVSANEVTIQNGSIGAASRSPEPLSAVVARAGGADIIAEGSAQPGAEKQAYSMHSFGAVFVEVHIDRELGVIRVPKVVGRYGIGRLLNAKTGRSQFIGGVVWGLGMALMEESLLDQRTGRIVNANLAEYHVPTNADVGEIDVDVVQEHDPHINSLGVRGIGEIGITGVAAALANAVYHATGVRVRRLPITLDTLLV